VLVRAGGCATTLSTVLLSVCARDGVHEQSLAAWCEAVVVVVVVAGGAGGARKRQTQLETAVVGGGGGVGGGGVARLKGLAHRLLWIVWRGGGQADVQRVQYTDSASQCDAGEWEAWMGLLGVLWRCK
jgi:hypothetical protein